MREIIFTADFGGERRSVEILLSSTMAGATCQLYIDKIYYGRLTKGEYGWVLDEEKGLTGDDLAVLGGLVEDELSR